MTKKQPPKKITKPKRRDGPMVGFRVSVRERREIEKLYQKSDFLKLSDYCRARCLSDEGQNVTVQVGPNLPIPKRTMERSQIILALNAIGNNINQSARAYNTDGEIKDPFRLKEDLAELSTLMEKAILKV